MRSRVPFRSLGQLGAGATSVAAALIALALAPAVVRAQDPTPSPAPRDTTQRPASQERGTIAGQVIDAATARPLQFATVDVVGTSLGAQTDLDGRYRIANVPVGVHRIRARRLGYQVGIVDSIRVRAGVATIQNITLTGAATTLQAVRVEEAANAASDAAMIALQKAAPAVMDGISSQTIARAPGSNAADAITRVTGVSIVDKKFVVVRGLPERYSNTLLNSVELPSPEPLKKIVPLDIFPSSLLESIVTGKTATPDRPGDFAGGSVEIKTKEFPDNRVIQFNVSQDWNSLSTFERAGYVPLRGRSFFGFGGDGREMPPQPAVGTLGTPIERFAESMRNVWTPTPRRAEPGLGFGASIGDRFGTQRPLGYVLNFVYSNKVDLNPDRLYQFVDDLEQGQAAKGFVAREVSSAVDWGAIANFAFLPARNHKLGWKNLYTRNAEEVISQSEQFDTQRIDERYRTYQVRYVARELFQTQLTGDHVLSPLWNSRLEWKATAAKATRDEPDNRSARYVETGGSNIYALNPSSSTFAWFRFLDDDILTGNLDWSMPIRIWHGQDLQVKTGGLYRKRDRAFDASLYQFKPATIPPSGYEVLALPPEQAFAPEHLGTFGRADIEIFPIGGIALPYRSNDNLAAGYVMIDLPLPWRVRLVGGVRAERWMLDIRPITGSPAFDVVTRRRELDILPSANLTISLTERMNVRAAAYQTVARPDPRELSADYYIAVTGECGNQGDSSLVHTRILNGDVRWEFYPGGSELLAVSGFYKRFTNPVIEVVSIGTSSSCVVNYKNAESAINYGGELEIRKSLGFLPGVPEGLLATMNLTLVQTEASLANIFAGPKVQFMGQSPYVVNASLLYTMPGERITVSLLANAFGDRITRYGGSSVNNGALTQIPHVKEKGRLTLDAKLQALVLPRLSLSVSAKNLTGAPREFFQDSKAGPVRAEYSRSGTSVKLGVGYEM